ncbi:MAG: 2Fe-2S iron-sulfur cluster binding domain-containing protein [Sphingomonas sp.]|nr:2Fe-2S iron-sulfur cluster binding domain-containing protein [Sphingomonas sp.]
MLSTNTSPSRPDWRQFRVAQIVAESAVIKSFYLEPADGAAMAPHRAGQHLPIRLPQPGGEPPLLRTYTVSVPPSARQLRISVRKLGVGSSYLHDAIAVGDIIDCREPDGDFIIDTAPAHPVVMIAAGVGITPILSMISHLIDEGERSGAMRPIIFFYAARTKAERGFDEELNRLSARSDGKLTIIRLLQETGEAVIGADYEEQGILSASVLEKYLGFQLYDFYMCGPPGFMQAVYDALTSHGVADHRIFAEAFGPASLKRQVETRRTEPKAEPSKVPVDLVFNAAGDHGVWAPGAGSLLEFAESSGLTPEFGCREGACGACKTPLIAGTVAYFRETSAAHGDDEVLICSAVPATTADGSINKLVLEIG